MTENAVFIGKSEDVQTLNLKYANRHGLIAGATGTGKTVTVQILTEGFSKAGVPVFVADVKGDLAGLSQPGKFKDFLLERAETVGFSPYAPEAFPTCFWDLHGEKGHPVRATVSEMGPLLISRLLGLNDTQEGVLTLAFRVADDDNLMLLDLKDLRALLVNVANRSKDLSAEYGHVSKASVGAIQRRLLALEEQGGDAFFGETALDIHDFLQTDDSGMGVVNILAADKLMQTPKLYATFLLWLLSELFEELPEVGDLDKPKLVFFFDEAHLLFDDAPKALLEKIEQVVRLIRSKGVGVYFASQNPLDVPDSVSSQLGNRIVHGLRAYTPREQRVVKAVSETFRPNKAFSAKDAITELGV
ncbi:MAG: helicase HerA-like domain-containing protein, partial [Pseudomonadota bacterium]